MKGNFCHGGSGGHSCRRGRGRMRSRRKRLVDTVHYTHSSCRRFSVAYSPFHHSLLCHLSSAIFCLRGLVPPQQRVCSLHSQHYSSRASYHRVVSSVLLLLLLFFQPSPSPVSTNPPARSRADLSTHKTRHSCLTKSDHLHGASPSLYISNSRLPPLISPPDHPGYQLAAYVCLAVCRVDLSFDD